VDITENEHVVESVLTPRFITAATTEFRRVLECAKENIPDRKVSEIVRVMPELMMYPMRFRPLKDEAEPARRVNIPVVEEFADCDQQRVVTRRGHVATEERIDNQAAQDGVDPNLHRMLVEAGQNLEPARRVMDLVQGPPEELRFVAITMPPIINEGGKEIGD
jgi:hypothetical protein